MMYLVPSWGWALQRNPDWDAKSHFVALGASAATPLPRFCYAIALQK
jgi:hypothetical protein